MARAPLAADNDAPPDSTQKADGGQKQAEVKVAEARQAYERGDYQQSLGLLREAQSLYASPKLHFNFGLVYRALGRDVEALDSFTKFLQDAQNVPGERKSEAERQVSELRGRVAWLGIAADTDGAEVFIDGRSYGKTPLSTSVVVAPGPHQVVVQKDGQSIPYTDRVEARAGTEIRIQARVVLPPIAVAPASIAPPAALVVSAPPPPPSSPPLYKRWWVWTGAAALIGGAVTTILIVRSQDSSANICPDCNVGVFRVPGN